MLSAFSGLRFAEGFDSLAKEPKETANQRRNEQAFSASQGTLTATVWGLSRTAHAEPSSGWNLRTVSPQEGLPPHSSCRHKQLISVLLPMPSQWALQYFPFSGAGQVQAAFAHFFGG